MKRFNPAFQLCLVSYRSVEKNGDKDLDLQTTKWVPFDVVELKANTAAFDGLTRANQPPS